MIEYKSVEDCVKDIILGLRKYDLEPRRILKSGNRTIVFWADGTKTIVKRADDEAESDYAAFTAALGIKLYGSNSALKRIVERTETQKPKKRRANVTKESTEEYSNRLFDDMMRVSGMTWTCPRCKGTYPYELRLDGISAVCVHCGVGTKINAENAQKEANGNGTSKTIR